MKGVLVVIVTAALIGAGAPAHAHDGLHRWPTDGCTSAPDLAFRHACVHHDGCYATHRASRATCDLRFLRDMRAACLGRPPLAARACTVTAYLYYGAVRLLGGYFYHRPNPRDRIRTPVG